jgi:hypothetical protein
MASSALEGKSPARASWAGSTRCSCGFRGPRPRCNAFFPDHGNVRWLPSSAFPGQEHLPAKLNKVTFLKSPKLSVNAREPEGSARGPGRRVSVCPGRGRTRGASTRGCRPGSWLPPRRHPCCEGKVSATTRALRVASTMLPSVPGGAVYAPRPQDQDAALTAPRLTRGAVSVVELGTPVRRLEDSPTVLVGCRGWSHRGTSGPA